MGKAGDHPLEKSSPLSFSTNHGVYDRNHQRQYAAVFGAGNCCHNSHRHIFERGGIAFQGKEGGCCCPRCASHDFKKVQKEEKQVQSCWGRSCGEEACGPRGGSSP